MKDVEVAILLEDDFIAAECSQVELPIWVGGNPN